MFANYHFTAALYKFIPLCQGYSTTDDFKRFNKAFVSTFKHMSHEVDAIWVSKDLKTIRIWYKGGVSHVEWDRTSKKMKLMKIVKP